MKLMLKDKTEYAVESINTNSREDVNLATFAFKVGNKANITKLINDIKTKCISANISNCELVADDGTITAWTFLNLENINFSLNNNVFRLMVSFKF